MSVTPSSSSRSRDGTNPGTKVAGTLEELKSAADTAKFAARSFPTPQPLPVERHPSRLRSYSDGFESAETVRNTEEKLFSVMEPSVKASEAPGTGLRAPSPARDPEKSS